MLLNELEHEMQLTFSPMDVDLQNEAGLVCYFYGARKISTFAPFFFEIGYKSERTLKTNYASISLCYDL